MGYFWIRGIQCLNLTRLGNISSIIVIVVWVHAVATLLMSLHTVGIQDATALYFCKVLLEICYVLMHGTVLGVMALLYLFRLVSLGGHFSL